MKSVFFSFLAKSCKLVTEIHIFYSDSSMSNLWTWSRRPAESKLLNPRSNQENYDLIRITGVLSIPSGKEFLSLVNHDNTCISGLPEDMKEPIVCIPFYSLLYLKV